MDFVFAIPSYNRPEMVRTHTLETLLNTFHDIPDIKNYIYIFIVANQLNAYKYLHYQGFKLIVGEKGLTPQRNFIKRTFKQG